MAGTAEYRAVQLTAVLVWRFVMTFSLPVPLDNLAFILFVWLQLSGTGGYAT